MSNEAEAKKYFLFGIIVLGALIVAGLVWAVLAGPSPEQQNANTETGLRFTDEGDPTKGPADSKYIVRMFSDFQCPACRAAETGVTYAMNTYGDRVRFVWDDFPLVTAHKNARAAANAARCAEEQGKFWEYHDALYSNQPDWAELASPVERFVKYAGDLGLNGETFNSCVAAQKYAQKVSDDEAEGRINSVRATPTFFIGNRRFEGVLTNEQWDLAMKTLLATP